MCMRVAAVFVIYNPNIEDLKRNILKVIADVEVVILWFNSDCDITFDAIYETKIIRLGQGKNQYIAKPLNSALDYCVKNGITHLLTMDQDSLWTDLKAFLSEVENSPLKDVVIYAPNINGNLKESTKFLAADTVITSGALHDVKIAYNLGGFREDYKIYWVDSEFCYWAKLKGYQIFYLPSHCLKHEFGNSTKKVLGIKGYNYSPTVYFFLFRNMLWMRREHGKKAVSTKTILYTIKLLVPGIILCEKQKLKKLGKILSAFYFGIITTINNRRK